MTRPRLILAIRCAVLAGVCLWLAPEWFLVPLSLMMPVFAATGGQCLKCTNPTCHTSYQIVITGVTNGASCSDCASLNGTFEATGTCTAGVACQWTSTDPTACSGAVNGIGMTVFQGLGPVTRLTISMNAGVTGIAWSDVIDPAGGSIDCGFSSQSVTQAFSGSYCDGSASTCTVTAL